jgi:hypothetical protein
MGILLTHKYVYVDIIYIYIYIFYHLSIHLPVYLSIYLSVYTCFNRKQTWSLWIRNCLLLTEHLSASLQAPVPTELHDELRRMT